ncbi:MAG: hypothetical protein ABFS02_04455 [Pseudomonadota bacterium]
MSALLLTIHYVIFPIPIAEGFLAYVILFNPPWFRNFLDWLAQ